MNLPGVPETTVHCLKRLAGLSRTVINLPRQCPYPGRADRPMEIPTLAQEPVSRKYAAGVLPDGRQLIEIMGPAIMLMLDVVLAHNSFDARRGFEFCRVATANNDQYAPMTSLLDSPPTDKDRQAEDTTNSRPCI